MAGWTNVLTVTDGLVTVVLQQNNDLDEQTGVQNQHRLVVDSVAQTAANQGIPCRSSASPEYYVGVTWDPMFHLVQTSDTLPRILKVTDLT